MRLDLPLLPAGAILLLRRAMGIFLGGCVEACDIVDIVLAASVAMDGDRSDDTGDAIECEVAMEGDLSGCTGWIGN
jgi:hypothetical protein